MTDIFGKSGLFPRLFDVKVGIFAKDAEHYQEKVIALDVL